MLPDLRSLRLSLATLAALAAGASAPRASAAPQVWADQVGTGHGEQDFGSTSDRASGSYETGSTQGELGGMQLGNGDAFLARRDHSGNVRWTRRLGTAAIDEGRSTAPDASGGVSVAGNLRGVPGAPYDLQCAVFVARYGSGGDRLWQRELDSDARDVVLSAAPDGAGGIFATGGAFGGFDAASAGAQDVWIARLDGAGDIASTRQFGSSSLDLPTELFTEGADVVACGNALGDGALFGPLTNELNGWTARFVACDFDAETSYCTAGLNSTGEALGVGGAVHRLAVVSTEAGLAKLALDLDDASSPAS